MPSHHTMRYTEWGSLRLGLSWIYAGQVDSRGRDFHLQEPFGRDVSYAAWLLRRGSVTVESASGYAKATCGQWMIPTHAERHQRFEPDSEILSIAFHATWPDGSPVYTTFPSLVFESADHPSLERRGLAMHRFLNQLGAKDAIDLSPGPVTMESYLRVEGLFQRWLLVFSTVIETLGATLSRFDVHDTRLLKVVSLLDRLPLDEKFGEDALARESGLGRSQLDRVFFGRFGKTPRKYFEERRVDRACRCLNAGMAAKVVTYELGFRQLSHFSAWFKRATGRSPREYKAGG